MSGWLVVFEGVDGAGKSTQLNLLSETLEKAKHLWIKTREPTDGPWGRKIRASAQSERMSPHDELAAFVADRRQHVAEVIAPQLAAGKIVLLDRYYFSTVAYQGARGLSVDEVYLANAFAPEPDLLFVFDLDPKVGLERVARRGAVDLFEEERQQRRVREIFASIELPPRSDGRQRLVRIDASDSIEATAAIIWRQVSQLVG